MAAGRAYQQGEKVAASKDIPFADGTVIPKDTPGTVTHNSPAMSPTVRVKFKGFAGSYKVVPKNCVKP